MEFRVLRHLLGNLYMMAVPLMGLVLFSAYRQYFGNSYPVSVVTILFVVVFALISLLQSGYASYQQGDSYNFCFVIAFAGLVFFKKQILGSVSFRDVKFVPVVWFGRTESLQVIASSTNGQELSFGTVSPKKAEKYEMEFNLIKACA